MKKLMNIFVLVAAAAMTLASCQKNEIDGPVNKEVHFTIRADFAETKTAITDNGDKTYTPTWAKGDKIGVLFSLEGTAEKVEFENTADAGEIATFEGKHAFAVVEGASEVDGNLYAFYPSSAYNKVYQDGGVRLDLNAIQYPTSTSFDPSCDLLIAKPCYYMAGATGEETEVFIEDMYFARMMSVLRINLNSEFLNDETVKNLSFKAEGAALTGAMKFDLTTGGFVGNESTTDKSTVTTVYSEEDPIAVAGDKNSAYLVVAPVTIPSGTALTFTIETENYDIVKTINAPADMVMPSGNIAVINLTIKEADCTAIVAETRIWVEGFDNETSNKTQTPASESGVTGTGVTDDLGYLYSATNCNVRINNNGQSATNPYLYINAANSSFTASNIKIANEDNLALSVMVKGADQTLSVDYKESNSSTWSKAGNIKGTDSFASGKVIFTAPADALSLDIRLTGSGVMYVDDIVLEATEEEVPVVTLTSISLSNEKAEYTVGEAFVAPTVTAIYSDGSTLIVTEGVTFTEVDMSTPGDKTVTVSYQGKTAEYTFSVKEDSSSGETPEATAWVATSFADLNVGDQVVIVATKDSQSWAMANDNGTSSAPAAVSITYSGDKLTSIPADNLVWFVGGDAEGRIFYADAANGQKWLYCTSSNNGVRVGTNTANTFVLDATSGYLKHIDTGRYVGVYTTNPDWRCYTNTTGNTANQTFKFFVKSGDGEVVTPEPTPDPENPDTPETGEPTTITMTTFSATEASMDDNVSYTTAKGGGTSNPAINGGVIRLYQNSAGTGGGTITITAKDGYKLSSVTIGSSMATTVAYTIGTSTTKSTSASVSANGEYTVDDINATSITFYCMGTSSSSRLYVNYLSATYVAD